MSDLVLVAFQVAGEDSDKIQLLIEECGGESVCVHVETVVDVVTDPD